MLSCFAGLCGRGRKIVEESASSEPRIRVYGWNNLRDGWPCSNAEKQIRSEVLAMIHRCYDHVKQLKIRRMFDAGFSFGLLDPASNIIVNVLVAVAMPRGVFPEPDTPPWRMERELIGDMDERSLRGLVAFLTGLFPYLTESYAIRYLHTAEADPVVAAHLIIKDRGMGKSFGFTSDVTVATVETALKCAAIAGQHPNPHLFVLGWRLLSTSLKDVADIISSTSHGPTLWASLVKLLWEKSLPEEYPPPTPSPIPFFRVDDSWKLAASRSAMVNREMAFPGRETMKRMLLATIHGYYLQALARLPKDELRSRYHYSMFQAGHCYGPLDPVSNIILNTVWYDAAYPPSQGQVPTVDMISPRALLRIAVQSFYGLVSFLCTRCGGDLTPDDALRCLQQSGASLRIADPNLLFDGAMMPDDDLKKRRSAQANTVVTSVEEAYDAAAEAAHHPEPHAQREFFESSNETMIEAASEVLQDGHKLSSEEVVYLAKLLPHSSSTGTQQESPPRKLDRWRYAWLDRRRGNFWRQHGRVVTMVKSVLDMYSRQPGVPEYELHVICGVNEHVHGPEYRNVYHHTHINFLATCKDPKSDGASLVLFFAECPNSHRVEGKEDKGLCCPVSVPTPDAEQVRCVYCESSGSRIVHPEKVSFSGGGVEFEEVWSRRQIFDKEYTNDSIISGSRTVTDWVVGLDDDCIYSTAIPDDEEEEEDAETQLYNRRLHMEF